MASKLLWLGSLVTVAAASVLVTRLVTGAPSGGRSPAGQQLEERLARLEAERPQLGRAFARAGAQLGAAAFNSAALGATEEGTPEHQAQEEQIALRHAEQEAQHYDCLDSVARAGGGAAPAAQLRKNLQALRALPVKARIELDVAALECADALCRLEIRRDHAVDSAALAGAVPHLLAGMGGSLSMRPSAGDRAIYYIAAIGHQLPAMNR